MENQPDSTFDLLQKLLRNINNLRLTDVPMNTLAMAYKEGYDTAVDDSLNIIRREL